MIKLSQWKTLICSCERGKALFSRVIIERVMAPDSFYMPV